MWLFIIETPKGTSLSKSASFKMLQSCRKVLWITTQQKLGLRGTRPSPHFAQNGPIALKIPWTLSPLTCPRIPNLVRIGCTLPDLFRKDWFFSPKSNYNIGFQPAINKNIFLLYFTHFSRSPQPIDFYQIWYRRSPPGRNQLCWIFCWSVQAYWFCGG